MNVAIVDYGMGNLGSVRRALAELGAEAEVVADPEHLTAADRIILPGVGAFSDGMASLGQKGWDEALREQVLRHGKPLLGICLGMQLLSSRGSEGSPTGTPGLDLIPGTVEHLGTLGCSLRIPHVGWNSADVIGEPALFAGIPDQTDFYFVHSFAFAPKDPAHILARVDYGIPVVAAIQSGPVFGTQFHPEKSSKAGFQLLRNFLAFVSC